MPLVLEVAIRVKGLYIDIFTIKKGFTYVKPLYEIFNYQTLALT